MTDPNEPDDHDGYVDYVTCRSPGLDGRTYVDGERQRYPTLYEIAVFIADELRAGREGWTGDRSHGDITVVEPNVICFTGALDIRYRLDLSVMWPTWRDMSVPGKPQHFYTDTSGVSRLHPRAFEECPMPECSDLKLLMKESRGE